LYKSNILFSILIMLHYPCLPPKILSLVGFGGKNQKSSGLKPDGGIAQVAKPFKKGMATVKKMAVRISVYFFEEMFHAKMKTFFKSDNF
jgi:hypothetical protein